MNIFPIARSVWSTHRLAESKQVICQIETPDNSNSRIIGRAIASISLRLNAMV
ncbi:MAG: hypothetical protein RMX68_030915 [Aulosira sp. ZfuVER01]|nr:hypothetical protein [Aulosira sp. ZfuVER01]MDZ7996891.1 hypothetical protein [Aulosira sp. DedVER01a]MDZ8050017.1 hypothetical protein [Aulosira sp. ZfuCHP01]